jgi:hypothetical protein
VLFISRSSGIRAICPFSATYKGRPWFDNLDDSINIDMCKGATPRSLRAMIDHCGAHRSAVHDRAYIPYFVSTGFPRVFQGFTRVLSLLVMGICLGLCLCRICVLVLVYVCLCLCVRDFVYVCVYYFVYVCLCLCVRDFVYVCVYYFVYVCLFIPYAVRVCLLSILSCKKVYL